MTQIGTGSVYEYDIVSAYPSVTADLPTMEGVWLRGRRSPWGLHTVRFSFPNDLPWYPLPYRTPTGSVIFPQNGLGVYCTPELELAKRLSNALAVGSM